MTPLQTLQDEFEPGDLGLSSTLELDALLSSYLALGVADAPSLAQQLPWSRALSIRRQIRVLRRSADKTDIKDEGAVWMDVLGRIASLERELEAVEIVAGLRLPDWGARTVTIGVEGVF